MLRTMYLITAKLKREKYRPLDQNPGESDADYEMRDHLNRINELAPFHELCESEAVRDAIVAGLERMKSLSVRWDAVEMDADAYS